MRSRWSFFLLCWLLGPAAGRPAVFEHLSVERLAASSDAAVVARVTGRSVDWNESVTVIVTTFTLEADEWLAGSPEPGPLLVHRVGGEKDGLALFYEGMPEMAPGEEVAVFLRRRAPGRYVVSGMAQGVLRLRGGAFERELRGIGASPVPVERLSLPELRRRVGAGRAGTAR